MTLDIVEEHLYRGHPEVVGAEEEHGQLQALDLVEGGDPPVVVGIVNHDHCGLPPLGVLGIQVGGQLGQEEAEGVAVGLADVHRVEHLPVAGQCGDQVDPEKPGVVGHQVLLPLVNPPPQPSISIPKDRLIDVDDALPPVQGLNELGCCELPLQLGRGGVLDRPDGLDPPVSDPELLPKVKPQNPNMSI